MIRFILFLCLALGCQKAPLLPLIPERVVGEIVPVLEREYIAAENLKSGALYAAGLRAIRPDFSAPEATAAELVDALEKSPPDEQRTRTYKAIEGILKTLPLGENELLRPESLRWAEDPERKFGVGLVLRRNAQGFLALDLLEGSAALRAGVRSGSYLRRVDDADVSNMDLEEVAGRIRGPNGSTVNLEFDTGKHSLIRGEYLFRNILNASWSHSDGSHTAFLSLRSTLPGTHKQIKQILESIPRLSAVILDLRKVHLGELEESYSIADLFCQEGRLGSLHTRQGDKEFKATAESLFTGPIYVIIGAAAAPMAHTLTFALNACKANVVGPAGIGAAAFVGQETKLPGGLKLRLTGGYALSPEGKPLHQLTIPVTVAVPDILPVRPPLPEADLEDPAQKAIRALLEP
ncbi:MAG: hypothetical protein HS115_02815 [Spirochaetales bacterium]|nr:hypothetical protein [Spirochaetales bacterium]